MNVPQRQTEWSVVLWGTNRAGAECSWQVLRCAPFLRGADCLLSIVSGA